MPAGLQLFYANGGVNLDTSTGIPRYLGITPSVFSGSVQVPEWSTQRPWYVVHRDVSGQSPLNVDYLTVTVSGTTLSWSENATNAWGPSRISYGCY
ncbi:hypothetical protein MT_57045 [Pseudomonas phage phiPto-bp6g]|nr:hypothetical protein MT_57045 [Pseudomonas phage phiPto-bp6g]